MKIDRRKGQKLDGNLWTMLNEEAKEETISKGRNVGD
jgi:hypothetical protein